MKRTCSDLDCSVKAFKALADHKRLRAAALLAYAGRELCVCELVDALDESQYNVSRCLTALCAAGIIKKKKCGRWTMYALADKRGPLCAYIGRLVKPQPCCAVVAKDISRLDKRLARREKGVCVVGGQC